MKKHLPPIETALLESMASVMGVVLKHNLEGQRQRPFGG